VRNRSRPALVGHGRRRPDDAADHAQKLVRYRPGHHIEKAPRRPAKRSADQKHERVGDAHQPPVIGNYQGQRYGGDPRDDEQHPADDSTPPGSRHHDRHRRPGHAEDRDDRRPSLRAEAPEHREGGLGIALAEGKAPASERPVQAENEGAVEQRPRGRHIADPLRPTPPPA
jgi:hypothetical protein